MKAYIITTFLGTVAGDEKNKIIIFRSFPKIPEKMAEKLKFSEMEVIQEEKNLMQELWKKGYKEFVFSIRKSGARHSQPGNQFEKYVKENLRTIAVDRKLIQDQAEFNQLLTKVNIELTKVKIKKAFSRDILIINVNSAIEEIDKSLNIFVERLREWYATHFPEMDRIIADHERFAKIITNYGDRKKIDIPELNQFKEKSSGMDLEEEDIKTLQLYSSKILELYKLREGLEKYEEKLLKELAPNLRDIAGNALAAKLIGKAGGLEKLARMATSTVQLIGAEKALFRFLHGKGKSPKYGILYSHPLVQNAPMEHRGKIARTLASKLSIAAKIDFYSKEYRGEKMKNDLNERVKEILSQKENRDRK